MSLFRKEALDAKRASWLGQIALAQPVRLWVLTAAAVIVALLVTLFLVFGTYTRRSRVVGQLVPTQGLATVVAPATGVVTHLDVSEGSRVSAGQLLGVVAVLKSTPASGDTIAALQQRLEQRRAGLTAAHDAEAQLVSAQSRGLAQQISVARRELEQIEQEIVTHRGQVDIAKETLERLRQLMHEKYVSELQAKQQEAAVLDKISETQTLERQATGMRRLIAQLQQALQELPGQRSVSQATYQSNVALLEQEQVEISARGELIFSASVNGVVATHFIKPGQAVQLGQPLLSVLPGDGTLEAELLVPSRAMGFIEPGDKVLLRYHAYPYQKFGHQEGRVARISRSSLIAKDRSLQSQSEIGEPLYRITVELGAQTVTAYGELESLKPGMLLEADILSERRTLVEWVFEPLYSLYGKVGNG